MSTIESIEGRLLRIESNARDEHSSEYLANRYSEDVLFLLSRDTAHVAEIARLREELADVKRESDPFDTAHKRTFSKRLVHCWNIATEALHPKETMHNG